MNTLRKIKSNQAFRARAHRKTGASDLSPLVIAVSAISSLIIVADEGANGLRAAALAASACVFGTWLCKRNANNLGGDGGTLLGCVWLSKVLATIIILKIGWIPSLGVNSANWGYDPQRYYYNASDLIEHNWSAEFISVNYGGILYYYGAIFAAFGHSPYAAATINSSLALIASLLLIVYCQKLTNNNPSRRWILFTIPLLPELIWYDSITSRESPVSSFLTIGLIASNLSLVGLARFGGLSLLILIAFCGLAIASIRTSMVAPYVLAIGVVSVLVRTKTSSSIEKRIAIAAICAALFIIAPAVTTLAGGYEFNILGTIDTLIAGNDESISQNEWSYRSIGLMLMPQNAAQAVLFLIPRTFLYIVSPLPYINVNVLGLIHGQWDQWQGILTICSSTANVIVVPFALAGLWNSAVGPNLARKQLGLHLSTWILYVSIAGGNVIIHERYRVMATAMLFACAWLGVASAPKKAITISCLGWIMTLTGAGLSFLYIKMLS